jgi:methanogenic corrinoid protein MtbC1
VKETGAALPDAGLEIHLMIDSGRIDEQISRCAGAGAYGRDAMVAVAPAKEGA